MTLFGNRVSADVIKMYIIMRSCWNRVGTNPMTGVLMKTREFGIRHTGKVKAEIGETRLQAKEHQRLWVPVRT